MPSNAVTTKQSDDRFTESLRDLTIPEPGIRVGSGSESTLKLWAHHLPCLSRLGLVLVFVFVLVFGLVGRSFPKAKRDGRLYLDHSLRVAVRLITQSVILYDMLSDYVMIVLCVTVKRRQQAQWVPHRCIVMDDISNKDQVSNDQIDEVTETHTEESQSVTKSKTHTHDDDDTIVDTNTLVGLDELEGWSVDDYAARVHYQGENDRYSIEFYAPSRCVLYWKVKGDGETAVPVGRTTVPEPLRKRIRSDLADAGIDPTVEDRTL
jgi:hypothetical protein